MPALPVLSGRKAVRAFEKLGWQVLVRVQPVVQIGCFRNCPESSGNEMQQASSLSDLRIRINLNSIWRIFIFREDGLMVQKASFLRKIV